MSAGGRWRAIGATTWRSYASALAAVAAALLVVTLTSGCESEETFEEESRSVLALGPQTRIVIDNARGNVRLVASPDSSVRLEARKRVVSRTYKRSRELASEVQLDVEREGSEFRILVTFPEQLNTRRRHAARERASVYLDVYVPVGAPIRVATVSADCTAENTVGALEFRSTSGDLTIERHRGPVLAHTASGDLSITRLEGVLDVRTTSGDLDASALEDTVRFDATSGDFTAGEVGGPLLISAVSGDVEANNVAGEVHVTTASGDVAVGSRSGVLDVSTTSGDVTARLDAALTQAQIETTSGDVDLTLPDPASGRLDVTTASGEVMTRLKMRLERATRRQLSGVLGDGGRASVTIRTSSGDISVAQDVIQ